MQTLLIAQLSGIALIIACHTYGWSQQNWLLVGIALATTALEGWMLIEARRIFPRVKGVLEVQSATPAAETARA